MAKEAHWLAGIEDVLTAETGDLRKLAEIAGNDPATFYIGTCMDGYDLRGQDLRGMKFTNFDITKVLVDEKTLLDPEYMPAQST
jgi:hypothetical protein